MCLKSGYWRNVERRRNDCKTVPHKIDYAVEMYIEPMDLPLVNEGQKILFVFRGIPEIVLIGWPQGSFETFGGIVSSFESIVSINGKFSVLVIKDTSEKKWPKKLRMGSGVLKKTKNYWIKVKIIKSNLHPKLGW